MQLATPAIANLQSPSLSAYAHWGVNGLVVAMTVVTVSLCVLLHYEALNLLSRRLAHLEGRHRRRVVVAISGLLAVHIAEIWIFGLSYALLLGVPAAGIAHGVDGSLLDFVYLSAMTFSTVGSADVYLVGPVRFLSGTEALAGLVLITWSASFTFLEMQRFWRDR